MLIWWIHSYICCLWHSYKAAQCPQQCVIPVNVCTMQAEQHSLLISSEAHTPFSSFHLSHVLHHPQACSAIIIKKITRMFMRLWHTCLRDTMKEVWCAFMWKSPFFFHPLQQEGWSSAMMVWWKAGCCRRVQYYVGSNGQEHWHLWRKKKKERMIKFHSLLMLQTLLVHAGFTCRPSGGFNQFCQR